MRIGTDGVSRSRRDFLVRGAYSLSSLAFASFLPVGPGCSTASTQGKGASNELDLLAPGEPGYADTILGYNATLNGRKDLPNPQLVALPRNETAVAEVLRLAHSKKLPLHIRGGGHSFEGLNTGPGMLLSLSGMNAIEVDASRNLVRVGAGARLGEVATALAAQGQWMPMGSCPSVGIVGLTLGGGYGLASRKLGLACDALKEVRLIDARGKSWVASERENRELFWAHRGGGGGNFGVVTQLTFKTTTVRRLSVLKVALPPEKAEELLKIWQASITQSRDELGIVLFMEGAASGMSEPVILAQYWGSPSEAHEAFRPFYPLFDKRKPIPTFKELSSLESFEFFGGPARAPLAPSQFKGKSHYFKRELSPSDSQGFLKELRAAGPGWLRVILDPYRGAIGRVPRDETAFVHRDALFSIQYRADWSQAEDRESVLRRLAALYGRMQPISSGAYVNYCDKELPSWDTAYYGSHLPRLRSVKRTVDPEGFFHHDLSL
jgi:hypothetical protein